MIALFKHEIRAWLNSPAAYAVGGLFLAIAAVYYTLDNVRGRSGDLSQLYSTLGTLFLFIVPVLTSRVIAEERRSGMQTLLITSPSGIAGIVAGKFFAVFALLVLMTAFTLLFPLLLLLFTPLYPPSLLGYYAGLLLLEAAIAALGIFASSLTESQVVAAIISFVTLLFLLIMRPIGAALGGDAAKVLGYLSPFARYAEFGRGVFSLSGTLYFIGFTFAFLFMTVCLVGAGRHRGNFTGKLYSAISIASVLAIILLANLIADLFPLKADLSAGKRYTVGGFTKELLAGLDRDIAIYGLFDDGKADADYIEVKELLENYAKHSGGKVRIIYADPDRDTRIIPRLDRDGIIGLRKNDFYVTDETNGTSAAKGKKIGYQDLFQMDYDRRTQVWFNTGSGAEKAFSEAIRSLSAANQGKTYTGEGYTLLYSGGEIDKIELPEFYETYSELLLEVPESAVIPLDFYGLYFQSAREFDAPDSGTILVSSPGGKALAAAWESEGRRYALIGSSGFLNDRVKTERPANFVTNKYFVAAALEWVNAGADESGIAVKSYGTGELQIPRYKADYIGFLTVIVLPLAVFLRGFVVWKKRRFL
jgi:ABC-2 type transport system permease protein